MIPIVYLKGDVTAPQVKGPQIIAHVCNDAGGWGKGFVLALSKCWTEPEKAFRAWYRERNENNFALGSVQFVAVQDNIWIANMIGQHGVKTGSKGPPVRYETIEKCLAQVTIEAKKLNASVHMPRIGCGLAGGKWEIVEPLVSKALSEQNIEVYVYDFD
jgi:O-acetyl-ADP-ribose deacetylase (regulator of RNase III)